MKENIPTRILYPASLSFRIKGEIKTFSDIQKLKQFIKTKAILKKSESSSSGK